MIRAKELTVRESLIICAQKLRDAGVENPKGNAEIILSKILEMNRSELFLNYSRPLVLNERRQLERLLWRRIIGEPVQYIVGETEFFGLTFNVDRRVMIPRPETELLVEWALECLNGLESPKVLDIGTGSGAMAVAIAANTSCRVTAVDKNLAALELAAENSRLNDVRERIQFVAADLFNEDFRESVGGKYDLIACNPPYISRVEMEGLPAEIQRFEPYEALTDGKDGLEYCRRLVEIIPQVCRNGSWVMVETAEMRAEEALHILSKVLMNVTLKSDLAGRPRIVGGRCSLN
ncbi:MAG: peptide chain release factor N(5)-glutamine methyltransferase [candidate division Zixibacteria bacterium]|nr:peptide chain release factor N(5)-glutamine methyltransferase [Candidatus Tariuqbacter arcticus]